MNIVRTLHLLKKTAYLATLLASSLLLAACGGSDSKKSTSTSSSSSISSSSHSFSSTPVTPPGSGTWPDVKVSANGKKTLKFEWSSVAGATFYKLFKKVDSNSAYEQVGANFTTTSISTPISVHLTDWVNSRYKVQACGDTGCQDSSEIITNSAMLSAITYIKASNTGANDWFGWSLAISADGSTMAVGATVEASNARGVNGDQTNNASPASGAVYIFIKVDGAWQQQAYLKASNTARPDDETQASALPNARFGYQVALNADGNTLAVTALNEHSPSTGINCQQDDEFYAQSSTNSSGSSITVVKHHNINYGAVYIFKRVDTQWSQTDFIKAFNNWPDLNFGYSLALSADGTTLAIGTPAESTYVNGVKPLERSASSTSTISSSSSSCYDYNASYSSTNSSGSSTSTSSSSSSSSSNSSSSISETSSVNSSRYPGGPGSGAVYIYRNVSNTWKEEAFIKATDTNSYDQFAVSISLSADGDTLAVGAPGNTNNLLGATETVQIGTNSATNPLRYLRAGSVYIFKHTLVNDTNTWTQSAKIKASNNVYQQGFGYHVALSGNGTTLAVGSPFDWSKSAGVNADGSNYNLEDDFTANDKNSPSYGAAYVFTNSNDSWTQQAYIKASNPMPNYGFGGCVALSYDGNILAVGSVVESSQARGINGDQADTGAYYSGAAYLFTRSNTSWLQKSYIKAPNSQSQDRFARTLGLDASGSTLSISAYKESSNAQGVNGSGNYTNQEAAEADNSAPAAGAVYLY